jgi:pimeloyl-ACP methyl ester carboxylesterase
MLFAGVGASAGTGRSAALENNGPKPTIVLIHGAFADASGWGAVITGLQHRGYTVLASVNPLRGVASDSAYIASILATIPGPIALVGHTFGGEVIRRHPGQTGCRIPAVAARHKLAAGWSRGTPRLACTGASVRSRSSRI